MQPPKTFCPFCDPKQRYRYILTTEKFMVMYPKNPDCAYHVLIVPKKHTLMLSEIPNEEFTEIGGLIKKLDLKARQKLQDAYTGFNLLSNNGGAAVNQVVPHAHLHLFLRTNADKHDPITQHTGKPIGEFSNEELKNLKELQSWF